MAKKSTEQTRAERTAALLKERQAAERRRQLTVIGGIVLLLVIIAAGGAYLMSRGDKVSNSSVPDSQYGLKVGPDSAPTKVVIYEDFICPICGYFESQTSEKLKAAADAGKVQVEYRPIWLLQQFEYSERAANAFRAVWVQDGEDAAMKMHNLLYTEQPAEEGPYPDNDWLVEKAVAAGADEAKIRPAIEDMDYRDWVTAATKDASSVRGTPTVYINGKILEAGTIDAVVAQLLTQIG
jgi:protein-disulfide isomerase